MPHPRFFETLAPLSAAEAAAVAGAMLVGAGEGLVTRVSDPAADDLSDAAVFAAGEAAAARLVGRRFGLCLTTPALARRLAPGGAVAAAEDPKASFMRLARALHRTRRSSAAPPDLSAAFVHPTAVVEPDATLGEGATVEALAYVGRGVAIGPGVRIGAGARITHALIGARSVIGAGAVIGEPGFGFVRTPEGLERAPQLGHVEIGDDVEIGANCTIDRGALGPTVIGAGTKIDALCHVAHNVRIGRSCVIAAQTGLSGSVVVGDGVMMGGQVGVADHLTIGAGAQLAARAGVMRDVPPGERWGGYPARPLWRWLRETTYAARAASRSKGKTTHEH